jgi:hypothetical protein
MPNYHLVILDHIQVYVGCERAAALKEQYLLG